MSLGSHEQAELPDGIPTRSELFRCLLLQRIAALYRALDEAFERTLGGEDSSADLGGLLELLERFEQEYENS